MSTSASNKMTNSLLNEIKAVNKNIETNTKNINVNIGDVNLNTDTLEAKLDTFSGHGNNNIGEGSTKLQIYNYGRDVAAGNFKPMVVNSSAEQIVALSAVDNAVLDSSVVQQTAINTKLDSYAGGGNNNIGEGSTKLQIFNYGRDVAAGNFKPMVVNSSAEQIVALSSVDNAVLDTIATNTANINVNVGDVEINVADLETLQASTNTKLDTLIGHNDGIEGKLDHLSDNSDTLNTSVVAVTTAVDALRVQNNGDLNDAIGKLDHISDNLDTIDGSINTLEACVGSNKVNVNISSGAITGFATETTLGNAEAHLGNIDTGVDVLEACVGSNKVNVNIASGNISGFATETTLGNAEAHLGTIDTNIANAETHLGNIDTGVDVLEACVGSNKVNVNIASGNISGFATETTLGNAEAHLGTIDTNISNAEAHLGTIDTNISNAEAHLGNIDTGVDVLEACVASNKVNVNIASGNISGFSTSANQTTLIGHVDGVETLLGTIDEDTNDIKTNTAACATDLAALEVLQTATNSKLDAANTDLAAIEVLLTAANVDHAANEVLLGTIDSDTNDIKTNTAACATDLAALEVLVTNQETHLSNIDSLSRTNIATGSSTLSNSEEVGHVDCSKFSEICVIYLTDTTTIDRQLFITGSTTSGGTYNIFAQMALLTFIGDFNTGSISQHMYATGTNAQHGEFIPCVFPFIKIKNKTGVDLTDTDNIRIIGR